MIGPKPIALNISGAGSWSGRYVVTNGRVNHPHWNGWWWVTVQNFCIKKGWHCTPEYKEH